jgi:hypothetical protein
MPDCTLPNLHFHVSIAHALLRLKAVDICKMDFWAGAKAAD